jgi:hypothetical protein
MSPAHLTRRVAGKGIITMAFGRARYLGQAIHLARSLAVTNPQTPRALVTDVVAYPGLARYFDYVIPLCPQFGSGTAQKTHLFDYSPFEETLFIDADCLALRPFADLWAALGNRPYGVLGHQMSEGQWWFDIARGCKLAGRSAISKFNGGVYYFDRTPLAESIARRAQHFAANFSLITAPLELKCESKAVDEVCTCFSLAEHQVPCVEDYELRRQIGPVQMSVGRVQCDIPRFRFSCQTPGATYHSFVGHFFLDWDQGFHYRREALKLRLIVDRGWPCTVASSLVNALWNPPYYLFTQCYRLANATLGSGLRIPPMACLPYAHFFGGARARIARLKQRLVRPHAGT